MNQNSFHPIIYVRGYAMTENEIEDTVADPYMGFNLGSCKTRQMWDGSVKKYFFESPLVRLLKQFEYRDVYDEGLDRVNSGPEASSNRLSYKSIVIYRYYEPSSNDLGTGSKPDMRRFAEGLSQLILDIRSRIYPQGASTPITNDERKAGKLDYAKFRVYLVAHSMGGLVVRSFLQNNNFASEEARKLVDKVFTYATPHNGIELSLIGNVPRWLSIYDLKTFNRDEAAAFLDLSVNDRDNKGCVDIVKYFPIDRIFNLVGTDPGDYKVAAGLSSAAVGPASDGLVRISNATTRARQGNGFVSSPNAFVHRSHSGYFGIVNSEEGYQNLIRFLFGDIRVDGRLEVDDLTLPPDVQKEKDAGKEVKASYFFEITISVRGKSWQLHRRLVDENSAVMRTFDELFPSKDPITKAWQPDRTASPQLFNLFLDQDQSQTKLSGEKLTLAFAADICVRSTGYEVAGVLFFKNHYEGGYLFRDMVTLEATPPSDNEGWKIRYKFENQRETGWIEPAVVETPIVLSFEIPIVQTVAPGIRSRLCIETRFWNDWQ